MAEKHGNVVELPLTCGTCRTVHSWHGLRWCGCCDEAICPTCFPEQREPGYPYRCPRCQREGRKTHVEIAGEEIAKARGKAFFDAFFGD